MVTLVGAMDTLGDSIAIQRVSWRKPRAIDFRSIQGAIGADGVGNLLSGLAGTVPNTTYGMSIAVAELTGVAARRIGICVGAVFVVFAFLPKFVSLLVAIPGPVVAAYYVIIVAVIFVFGMKILLSEGLDPPKGPRGRRRVLARHRLPVRLGLPGVPVGGLGRAARQRHDRRWPDRDPADDVRGGRRRGPVAPQDPPDRRDVARSRRVPRQFRRPPERLEQRDGNTAARGGRGNDANPDA